MNKDEVSIEIFGRSHKRKSSGGKELISEASLRIALSRVRQLKEYSDELDIKFVGLDDTGTADKIHLRYLYTEKYLFAVEHSFETRKGKMQKVWFDTTEDLATFQRRYREQSIDFDVSFSFYTDEVF